MRIEVLEFNLSQFDGPADLTAAFQRLRDQVVRGTLPLVFWDEFDSALEGRELGWLVHFLSPMQDGEFAEEGILRPLGSAIFVVAGGTHATLSSVKTRATDRPELKGTDFLSRLRGFVDILGPNPVDDEDDGFVLRRTFLLRGLLMRHAPQIFSMDGLTSIMVYSLRFSGFPLICTEHAQWSPSSR